MMKRQAKDLGWRCLTLYLPLILFLVGTLFPFYWIVNTSLKDSVEVLSLPIKYWPEHPTLSNYLYLFEKMGFGNNVANTAFVAILTTILVTLLSNGKTASYQQPMESGIDLHLYEPSILHVHDDGLLQFSAP